MRDALLTDLGRLSKKVALVALLALMLIFIYDRVTAWTDEHVTIIVLK